MMDRLKCYYLKINSEYYAFLSGALISIPLSLFLDIKDNIYNIYFWLSMFLSTVSSLFCFMLSIQVKTIHEKFEYAKKGYLKSEGGEQAAWNAIISDKSIKKKCIPLFYLMILTLIISLYCAIMMQFIVTESVQGVSCFNFEEKYILHVFSV